MALPLQAGEVAFAGARRGPAILPLVIAFAAGLFTGLALAIYAAAHGA